MLTLLSATHRTARPQRQDRRLTGHRLPDQPAGVKGQWGEV